MKKHIMKILLILLTVYTGCKEDPPVVPPPPPVNIIKNTINLTIEWTDLYRIKLKWNKAEDDTLNNFLYNLIRRDEAGNEVTRSFYIAGNDTTYIDDNNGASLGTGKTYSYSVKAFNNENELKDTSKTITAATLSPTSHNIEWRIDTLGQPGNFLNDIWGLNENCVYAVGGINMPEGVTSIIKWDGERWNYHSWPEGGASGIWGFSENNIFIVGEYSNRGFIGHYDGSSWTEYRSEYFLSKGDTVYPLRSVWGSSPDDVWAVGNNGTIIHWDGLEWSKVKNIDEQYTFWDVWGFSENSVYAAGNYYNNEVVLFYYNGNNWEKIFSGESINPVRSTVWGPYEEYFYLFDYRHYLFNNGTAKQIFFNGRRSPFFKIRGEGINNIYTVGDFSEIFHFNGISWKRIDELYTYPNGSILFSCTVKNGKFFGVGLTNDNGALVIRGSFSE
jgi:hypothetical protein